MAEFVNPRDYTAKKRACEAYNRIGNRMQCISYDFTRGDILNGLNVPSSELKELENQEKIKRGKSILAHIVKKQRER